VTIAETAPVGVSVVVAYFVAFVRTLALEVERAVVGIRANLSAVIPLTLAPQPAFRFRSVFVPSVPAQRPAKPIPGWVANGERPGRRRTKRPAGYRPTTRNASVPYQRRKRSDSSPRGLPVSRPYRLAF